MPGGKFPDDRLRDLWKKDPGALGGAPAKPLTVSFPAVEQVIVQVGTLGYLPFGRALSSGERTLIESVYDKAVDHSRIRIAEGPSDDAAVTLGNQILVPTGMTFTSEDEKALLIHEAAHVWQYQTRGTRYISCSVFHQLQARIKTGDVEYAYKAYVLDDKRTIYSYPAEEQASIIEDYYNLAIRYKNTDDKQLPTWAQQRKPDLPRYERLIKSVRQARPLSQVQIYENSLMQTPRNDLFRSGDDRSPGFLPVVPLLKIDF